MVPTADPGRQARRRFDLGLGVTLIGSGKTLEGQRLSFEFAVPVYEWVDGPQLETDWKMTIGWNWEF